MGYPPVGLKTENKGKIKESKGAFNSQELPSFGTECMIHSL